MSINLCINSTFSFKLFIPNELAITCGKPPILSDLALNSRNSKSQYLYGQKLQLRCNRGYELKGESYIQCLASGFWSRSISNCSSKHHFQFN